MEKKSQDFSIQEAQRLAKTPQGQELIRLMQEKDSAALEKAMADGMPIFLVPQIDLTVEAPGEQDLYQVGPSCLASR